MVTIQKNHDIAKISFNMQSLKYVKKNEKNWLLKCWTKFRIALFNDIRNSSSWSLETWKAKSSIDRHNYNE